MKSEAVRVAQIERDKALIQELSSFARHPVISIVLAFVIIESLQQVYIGGSKDPLMGKNMGTVLETCLATQGVISEVSKAVVPIIQAVNPVAAVAGALK